MKILLFGYEYPPLGGGVANALKNLLAEFSTYADLEIDFVTSSLSGKFEVEQVYPRITFHRIPIGKRAPESYHKQRPRAVILYAVIGYLYAWKLILRKHYDLSHCFGLPGPTISMMFRWRMPYIASLRGVEVPGYNPKYQTWHTFYRPLVWLSWKLASKLIANSSKLKDLARKADRTSEILVIPNGVDTDLISPGKSKFDNFTVTAGGTIMGPKKGLQYLVEGFALLNREFPDTRLKLIGSGDLEPEIRALIQRLNIESAVELLGRKNHEWIEQNLSRFHVLCLPSLNEGMSNAMLEGLAAGLPLVITDTGGAEELLANANGFIVEQRSPRDIFQKLKTLRLDDELRETMGRRSRQLAESMSWKSAAKRYYEIYQSI
jgi:glycosyltransferase involved in cell wall biosynthesis